MPACASRTPRSVSTSISARAPNHLRPRSTLPTRALRDRASLSKNPAAPLSSASKTYSSRSNVVITMTRVPGNSARTLPSRSQPVAVRHSDIHQHDVRTQCTHLLVRLDSRLGMPDDANLGGDRERNSSNPCPYHLLVVCNKDIDHALILPVHRHQCLHSPLTFRIRSGVQLTTHERRAFRAFPQFRGFARRRAGRSIPESIDHPYLSPHRLLDSDTPWTRYPAHGEGRSTTPPARCGNTSTGTPLSRSSKRPTFSNEIDEMVRLQSSTNLVDVGDHGRREIGVFLTQAKYPHDLPQAVEGPLNPAR